MVLNRYQGNFSGLVWAVDWKKRNLQSVACSHIGLRVQIHTIFGVMGPLSSDTNVKRSHKLVIPMIA